jgi:hypothetical protein
MCRNTPRHLHWVVKSTSPWIPRPCLAVCTASTCATAILLYSLNKMLRSIALTPSSGPTPPPCRWQLQHAKENQVFSLAKFGCVWFRSQKKSKRKKYCMYGVLNFYIYNIKSRIASNNEETTEDIESTKPSKKRRKR